MYPQFVFTIPVSKGAAEFDRLPAEREGAKSVHDGDISHLFLHTAHYQVSRNNNSPKIVRKIKNDRALKECTDHNLQFHNVFLD